MVLSARLEAQVSSNGLVLWLKADKGVIADNKGMDSLWLDQSGNHINAFQETEGLRPEIIKSDVNGLSALRFGSGTFLDAPSKFPINSSYTIITVISPRNLNVTSNIFSGTSSRFFWFNGSAYPTFGQIGDSSAVSNVAAPIAFCTVTAIANDSSKQASIYLNGKRSASSVYTVYNADSGINIGAFAAYNTFEGDIAEVLVFKRALNTSELSEINTYLNNKYGINLPVDNDIILKHFPSHLQFLQRDAQDSSSVKIDGEIEKTGYDSAYLEVFKNESRVAHLSQPVLYSLGHALISFYPKIHAEMAEYSFKLHLKNGKIDTTVAREDGIVCGDAYIIAGQSNAVALSYGSTYINEYVRSFGSLTGYNFDTPDDTAWGYANGNYYSNKGISFIGGIGLKLAENLIKKYKIPLCIINGAVTGGPIEANLRNDSDPTDPSTVYGRMLYRMRKSGMDTCARAIIWYHGAANTIVNYYPNFTTLYNSWKSDYKNLKKFYVMQIRPSICGAGSSLALRELQRTLSDSLPRIAIVSVNNAPGHNGCHFDKSGYDTIGNWVTYLVSRDFYKSTDTLNINPLNIEKAFYSDTTHTRIKILFKEKNAGISWSSDTSVNGVLYNIKDAFYLDNTPGLVKSVSVNGDTLYLNLYTPQVFISLGYVPDHYYIGTTICYEGPWLINKRGIGAFAIYNFPVEVIPQLKANFNPGSVCLGQSYYFKDSSFVNNDSITNWKWDFGDGDSSALSKTIHTYNYPGQYQVTLNVQSSKGLSSSVTKTISVINLPDAHFTSQLLSERTMRFSAATNLKSTYIWDFGDGGSSADNKPTYTYASQGVYNVKLTVTNSNGCQASSSDSVHILFWIKADFGFNNNSCFGGYTYFKDSSTISAGNITKWQWDFGDYFVSKLQSPNHMYKKPGSYKVTLTVADAYGTSDTLSKIVNIEAIPNANFTWVLSSGRAVQFQADDSASGIKYTWSFGDGNTSPDIAPKHIYASDGNYTTNLKVENGSCWQIHSAVFSIISPQPNQKAFFSYSGKCPGVNTTFNDLSPIAADSITAWQWNFGDGAGSSAHNPQHIFNKPGTYQVQLKVLTINGTLDSITKSVIINALPNAGFKTKIQNKTMFFSAEDSIGPWYIWTFGDGFGSYYAWGFHDYFTYGSYNLTLAVKDSNGCINVHSDSIQIKTPVVSGIEDNSTSNSSLNIFPNPFLDHAQIILKTETPSEIGIKVYDITGRLISVIANGYEAVGVHDYSWNTSGLHLAGGMYIVKVRLGDIEVEKQLIKMQ